LEKSTRGKIGNKCATNFGTNQTEMPPTAKKDREGEKEKKQKER
jgi:hypothetical protein